MKNIIWSGSKGRISRRKSLALIKMFVGPLAAWLLSKGIEIEEQALSDGLQALFTLLGGWISFDAIRDWRNRNAEDDSQSLRGRG